MVAVVLAAAMHGASAPRTPPDLQAGENAARLFGERPIAGVPTFLHIRRTNALGYLWQQVDFAKDADGGVLARRQAGSAYRIMPLEFGDSQSCTGLAEILGELDSLRSRPAEAVVDGSDYVVWAPGRSDAADHTGGALGDWAEKVFSITSRCWKPAAPGS